MWNIAMTIKITSDKNKNFVFGNISLSYGHKYMACHAQ